MQKKMGILRNKRFINDNCISVMYLINIEYETDDMFEVCW